MKRFQFIEKVRQRNFLLYNQLNIQNVPTFISIRNGIVVSKFSGANEHRLRNMLNELNTI